jgi:hypothetical protein
MPGETLEPPRWRPWRPTTRRGAELLTSCGLDGGHRTPSCAPAAVALLEALRGLTGKAGFSVKDDREGGLLVELRAGDGTLKRAWVRTDRGVILVRPLRSMGLPAGEVVEVDGLRLTADESKLEGAQEDTYYQPRRGRDRGGARWRSPCRGSSRTWGRPRLDSARERLEPKETPGGEPALSIRRSVPRGRCGALATR